MKIEISDDMLPYYSLHYKYMYSELDKQSYLILKD
jgi:hypothetical protein